MSSMRGFTLIEVLIVLAIVTIAITIVAPNLMRTYEKVQVQAEIKMMTETLKDVGLKAFLSQTPQSVVMKGRDMVILPSKNTVHFSKFVFPHDEEICFNTKGAPNQTRVHIQSNDQLQEVPFKTCLDF